MVFKKVLHRKLTRLQKIKVSTRIWKVEINIPCKLNVQKKDEDIKMIGWTICQVLN